MRLHAVVGVCWVQGSLCGCLCTWCCNSECCIPERRYWGCLQDRCTSGAARYIQPSQQPCLPQARVVCTTPQQHGACELHGACNLSFQPVVSTPPEAPQPKKFPLISTLAVLYVCRDLDGGPFCDWCRGSLFGDTSGAMWVLVGWVSYCHVHDMIRAAQAEPKTFLFHSSWQQC